MGEGGICIWRKRLFKPSSDLLLAKTVALRREHGKVARTMRLLPMVGQWRVTEGQPGIGYSDILAYLASTEGMQIEFPFQVT